MSDSVALQFRWFFMDELDFAERTCWIPTGAGMTIGSRNDGKRIHLKRNATERSTGVSRHSAVGLSISRRGSISALCLWVPGVRPHDAGQGTPAWPAPTAPRSVHDFTTLPPTAHTPSCSAPEQHQGNELGWSPSSPTPRETRNGCDDAYLFDDGVQFNPALTPQGFPAES